MLIQELTAGTQVIDLHGLVAEQGTALTKAGKPFLRLTIQDTSGSIKGVMWDYDPLTLGWLKEGSVVKVSGEVALYQGINQLKVAVVEQSERSLSEFGKRTKFDVEKLWSHLVEKVGSFEEPLTKFVAEEILLKHSAFIEAFKLAPAAKGVHNAWFGGLLEHVWSLTQIGEPVIAHYKTHYYPQLSRDKVLFGLMMHDAGKVIEYDYTTPLFSYTALGSLANHMVLGPCWVYEAANRWRAANPQMLEQTFRFERAQLLHVLAAHHGRLDWGSPVKPATVEAVLVHHLDNTDAKVLHALDYVLGAPGATPRLSEKSYIEGTCYLQPPKDQA